MDRVPRIPHLDTREAIEKSLKEAGVWDKLHQAIDNLIAKRKAMGLPVNDRRKK